MAWRPLGNQVVGVVDFEWLEPGHEATPGHVDPKRHLVGRLFYPCEAGVQRGVLARKGVAWLPGYNYARGMLTFLFFRAPRSILCFLLRQALQLLACLFGTTQKMDLHPGAPLVAGSVRHPVVVFSHGLWGHRAMYSIACAEYASHGYVVLALEHADGTASACRLAGGKGWRFYRGLDGEAGQAAKTRHRLEEMKSAHRVLLALNRGETLPGLQLSHGVDPAKFLASSLDFKCLAAVGHSYGGATVAALVAEDPLFRCAVALDPWWYAVPPEASALQAWRTRSPLAIVSSHDWSVPGPSGGLPCCEGRQAAILEAAKARRTNGVVAGGGSLLLVVAGSSHNTFADPLPLLSQPLGWVLGKLGLASRLDPVLGIHLTTTATLNFLSTHLPLTTEQRAMQSWEPSKSHGALDKIKQRDVADQARTGLFATVLPRGKGLIDAASDYLLDQVLRHAVKTEFVREQSNQGGTNAPDDMLTALETFEAVLPSADPASGLHPHAPSQPTVGHFKHDRGQDPGEAAAAGAAGAAGTEEEVLAMIGMQYSSVVQPAEVEQNVALLGAGHIFKVEVHS